MKPAQFIYPLLSIACGAVSVLALPPYNTWLTMLLGMSVYYALFSRLETARGAFICGWLFGFGYFGGGLWWIANALLVPGNEFRWVWPFAIAGLPAICAFFPAFASLACFRYADRRKIAGYIMFAASFALSEWLRGHVFSGFPWNTYGYIWAVFLPIVQVAALGGSYFLTLMTLFWVTLPGFLSVWQANRWQQASLVLMAVTIFVAGSWYGHMRIQNSRAGFWDNLRVRIVQPNIPQEDKWNPDKVPANLKRMVDLSAPPRDRPESPTTLIVWPETALEFDVLANETARGMIRSMMSQYKNNVFLLTGLLRLERDKDGKQQYFNSLAVLDRELNMRAVYNKSHLVPFGEYIPLQDYVPMKPFVQFQGFVSGKGPETLSVDGAPSFSPLICYEVIFPHAVVGKDRPAWIVNVTNDAWYGDSPGPRQHFSQARFRAIEEGLPVVRSAETGISGVIDPIGRVTYHAPLNTMAVRNVGLPRPLPPTPYARFGDLLFFTCTVACLLATLKFHNYK